MKIRPNIVIKYPPSFDGELWIETNVEDVCGNRKSVMFKFIASANKEDTEWDILVKFAKEVLDQDARQRAGYT